MKRSHWITGMMTLAVIIAVPAVVQAQSAELPLDDEMRRALDAAPADQPLSALVYLKDQVNLDILEDYFDAHALPLALRHEIVVTQLQQTAAATQGALLATLDAGIAAGGVSSYTAFWLVNAVRVEALPAQILEIADRDDIHMIYANYPIELEALPAPPKNGTDVGPDSGGGIAGTITPGVQAVRAPEVWDLGIDGTGVLVATLDTGVDGNHPALASRWRGVADPRYAGHPEWAWFDPVTNTTFPTAFGSHGTHTMGSVCGGAPGEQVGVAPGAQWIHAATIDRVSIERTVSDSILAFQWMIDPDENPATAWDVPAVCSNSWRLVTGHGYPPCDETFWNYLDACEAAGTVIVFSAGNEGPSAQTIGRPPDRATDDYRTFSVGALDAQNPNPPWFVASFSSRGPSFCTPDQSAAIKPEISAPGVNVRSSIPGSSYGNSSGTSMASPHVNGVIALMRQANPNIPVQEIKQIIFETAYDVDASGEDNNTGWGMIDAYEAVQRALSYRSLVFSYPDGRPETILPAGGTTVRVNVGAGVDTEPQPGTGMLHVNDGSGWAAYAMDEGQPNEYTATFPPTTCGELVSWYVSALSTDNDLYTNPANAPDGTYVVRSIAGTILAFEDTFETDNGWTVQNESLTSGAWERGIPAGDGTRGDPTQDADGSGRCYLTGNAPGDSDVDGGPTRLTSPRLDFTALNDPYIAYARWFYNDDNNDRMIVEISNNDGATWTTIEDLGPSGGWQEASIRVADFVTPTTQGRVRFSVADQPNDSVTEAGVDAFRIYVVDCGTRYGDLNCDGAVDGADIDAFFLAIGFPDDYRTQYPNCNILNADMNVDGDVDGGDIDPFFDCVGNGNCP